MPSKNQTIVGEDWLIFNNLWFVIHIFLQKINWSILKYKLKYQQGMSASMICSIEIIMFHIGCPTIISSYLVLGIKESPSDIVNFSYHMKVLIRTVRTVKVWVRSAWQKFLLCGLKRTKGSGFGVKEVTLTALKAGEIMCPRIIGIWPSDES